MKRYSRQILFPPIGKDGQRRLLNSSVTIIGCGALGSVTSNLLARAGVGKIRIVDRDFVEITDLQRQFIFDEEDVRKRMPKAMAVREKLKKVNSEITIEGIISDANATNIEELVKETDLICDCTDNMETRFLINQVSIRNGIPWIYTACLGTRALLFNIVPENGPCLQCLVHSQPGPGGIETCETAGILGSIVGTIASIQSLEAIKILIGRDDYLTDLLSIDLWPVKFFRFKVPKWPDCPTCGRREFEFLKGAKTEPVVTLCGRNGFQVIPEKPLAVSIAELSNRLKGVGETLVNPYLLGLRVKDYEITIFSDGRAIIKGAKDALEAKMLYARYVGL